MRPLEDMRIGQRIMLTVAIIVIVLILLACVGYLSGRWEAESAPVEQRPMASKWDDEIDALEKQAIGEAFRKHIGQLYSVWVTDNYQPRIPPKALTGARNARDAYIRSMEAIEKRDPLPR
jgi:Na+-transporting methylmalonyl-CoA/oxaloacetate decarboxylase gamma subunit